MYDKFGDAAKRAIQVATQEARSHRSASVDPEHLLLGILADRDGRARGVLERLGVRRDLLARAIADDLAPANAPPDDLAFSQAALFALEHAYRFSRSEMATEIGTVHLLFGIVAAADGLLARRLDRLGVTCETIRAAVEESLPEAAQAERLNREAEEQGRSQPRPVPPVGAFLEAAATQHPAPSGFTKGTCEAISAACSDAKEAGHTVVGTTCLLRALLGYTQGTATLILAELRVDTRGLRDQLAEAPPMTGQGAGSLQFSTNAYRALEAALVIAAELGHEAVTTGHLLYGLLIVPEASAAQHLRPHGVSALLVRSALIRRGVSMGADPTVGLSPVADVRHDTLSTLLGGVPASAFTTSSLVALVQAADQGMRAQVPHIDLEDLLLALLREPDNAACHLLAALGVDRGTLLAELAEGLMPDVAGLSARASSPALVAALKASAASAGQRWPCPFITTVHLLHALLAQPDSDLAVLAANWGLTAEGVAEAAQGLLDRLDPEWLPLERFRAGARVG
ncbi:MAG TPA: Clp protease N-terminal domain-containing protein [bacterium]|nr:Clp protease N-terminal domain-containing protein [bacterium]